MKERRANSPTAFIGKAVTQCAHVVADGGPFRTADDANVLHGQDGKEQILVGSVIPIFIHGECDG